MVKQKSVGKEATILLAVNTGGYPERELIQFSLVVAPVRLLYPPRLSIWPFPLVLESTQMASIFQADKCVHFLWGPVHE